MSIKCWETPRLIIRQFVPEDWRDLHCGQAERDGVRIHYYVIEQGSS
jgi:hypothetical protein